MFNNSNKDDDYPNNNRLYIFIERSCFRSIDSKINKYNDKNIETKKKVSELKNKLDLTIKNDTNIQNNFKKIPDDVKGDMRKALDEYITNYTVGVSSNASSIIDAIDKDKNAYHSFVSEITSYYQDLNNKYDSCCTFTFIPLLRIFFTPYTEVLKDKKDCIQILADEAKEILEQYITIRTSATNYIK